ncbi:ATP-dependent zinc protease family protein [Pseudomonas sp. LRF_L74]|uniref:retropepsin-like aspartic peptidase RloA3 n=1 Tax=Pseudomonas sp. LRF_L74 TaxID=3369422 RepID=UPI003F6472EE
MKPFALPLFALLLAGTLAQAAPAQGVGWIENGLLLPDNLPFKMKMDTGALTSSLDAEGIQRFEKNGEKWVRFKVESRGRDDKRSERTYERKVERNVKVRGAGGSDSRPVVLMKVCIGNQAYEEQFTLRDREDMNYPVLIGRRTLEHLGPVDVSRTFTIKPNCPHGA